jgi:hypothetical protein
MEQYHGRDLTRAEWLAVVLAILDGRSVLVRRAGERSGEIHDVTVSGVTIRFAWEPVHGHIVTTLRDTRTTCKVAARVRDSRGRASVRIGRGFYDREGNRI